ncbi:MAG: outer membrane protein assembly factor BamE [Idiomarina sp.]|nr:outer membrane protein assembly factor BamE [Idiomarina sp.]
MRIISISLFALALSACSLIDPLVYKIDIPQGNFLEQRDVNRLRIGMTQEQVAFVLGSPVVEDAYRSDRWHYIYRLKPGRGDIVTRELTAYFVDGKLAELSGDFEVHEDFYTPLDS